MLHDPNSIKVLENIRSYLIKNFENINEEDKILSKEFLENLNLMDMLKTNLIINSKEEERKNLEKANMQNNEQYEIDGDELEKIIDETLYGQGIVEELRGIKDAIKSGCNIRYSDQPNIRQSKQPEIPDYLSPSEPWEGRKPIPPPPPPPTKEQLQLMKSKSAAADLVAELKKKFSEREKSGSGLYGGQYYYDPYYSHFINGRYVI